MKPKYRDELNEALDGLRNARTREEAADAYRRAINLGVPTTYNEFHTLTAAAINDSAWPAEFRRVVEDIHSEVMNRVLISHSIIYCVIVAVSFVVYAFIVR